MLVRDWMTREPLVVSPKTSMEEAIGIMRENRVRHLPVIKKGGIVVGIVTQTDLLQASPSPATSLSVWEIKFLLARVKVRHAMTRKVIVIEESCPLEQAALVMAEHKIGCWPVVRDQQLVGIITETDLFNIFTEQLGARKIIRLTTLPAQDPHHQIVTVKVKDVTLDELTASLSQVVVEVMDARQAQGWGTEGFVPVHRTLEG